MKLFISNYLHLRIPSCQAIQTYQAYPSALIKLVKKLYQKLDLYKAIPSYL